MTRPRVAHQTAFTLVELIIVIAILGILAALVAPRYLKASADSKAHAAATSVIAVQTKINEYNAINGEFPATIDPNWFAGKSLPSNPYDPDMASPIKVDDTAGEDATHPRIKFIRSDGTFWYNPQNGRFRALVSKQSTNTETLAVYNKANSSNLTGFTQTAD